jgi:hypothetical protein
MKIVLSKKKNYWYDYIFHTLVVKKLSSVRFKSSNNTDIVKPNILSRVRQI